MTRTPVDLAAGPGHLQEVGGQPAHHIHSWGEHLPCHQVHCGKY